LFSSSSLGVGRGCNSKVVPAETEKRKQRDAAVEARRRLFIIFD
jgi:hypothetical protein